MSGLLESLRNLSFNPTPMSTGLLMAGANMLQQGGPSLQPQNFGTSLGAGLQGLLQGYTGAQTVQNKNAEDKLNDASKRALQDAQAQYYLQGGSKGSASGKHVVGTKTIIDEDGKLKFINIMSDDTDRVLPYQVPNEFQYLKTGNEFTPAPKKMPMGGLAIPVTPTPNQPQPIDLGNNSQFNGDPSTLAPEDRVFMETLGLPPIQPQQRRGIPISPSRAKIQEASAIAKDKAEIENQQKIDQALSEKAIEAPNKLRIIDNRLADIDQAIYALEPKFDNSGKAEFGFQTGGFIGGSGITPSAWYELTNNPNWRSIQRVGKSEELQRAIDDMAKQGQITESERKILSLATGIDPDNMRSDEIYKVLLQAKERIVDLKNQYKGYKLTSDKPQDESLQDDKEAARIKARKLYLGQ